MEPSIDTLRTQLLQLKQLHDAGALPTAQYESSKAALEKRVLELVLAGSGEAPASAQTSKAAAPVEVGPPTAPAPAAGVEKVSANSRPPPAEAPEPPLAKPSRGLVLAAGGLVLAVALAGYSTTGAPSLAGIGAPPPAAAAAGEGGAPSHSVSMEQIAEMTQRLAARLKEQPQDAQGWAMLGRSYAVLGRNDEAVTAYETAIKQQGDDAVLIADYADALAVKNNRTLAGEPMKWVRRALELDPKNVKALALAGTDAFDRKDFAGAVGYWEELLKFGPSEGNFIQQVQASVAEARQLAGMGPAAAAPAPAPSPAPAQLGGMANSKGPSGTSEKTGAAQAAANASVSGTVTLNAALAAQAGPDDTVFIFARAAEGSRMPLAVLRKRVRDLPASFTLDDSQAMSPAAKLSGAPRVIVGARVSKSGNAMPSPGDLVGQVGPITLGSSGLAIEIREQVKP